MVRSRPSFSRSGEVVLDLVAVASPVAFLGGGVAAGSGQVVDDAVHALRSVIPSVEAMSRSHTSGSSARHSRTRAWFVKKLHSATSLSLTHS